MRGFLKHFPSLAVEPIASCGVKTVLNSCPPSLKPGCFQDPELAYPLLYSPQPMWILPECQRPWQRGPEAGERNTELLFPLPK